MLIENENRPVRLKRQWPGWSRYSPLLLLLAGPLAVGNAQAQDSRARWIWYPDLPFSTSLDGDSLLPQDVRLAQRPQQAVFWVMVDDGGTYWLNGQELGPSTERRGGCTGFC